LKRLGIRSEPSPDLSAGADQKSQDLYADRQALAQRIAKHEAPARVKLDSDAAKRELIKLSLQKLLNVEHEPDPVLDFMMQYGMPFTRENYLFVAYLGNPPQEMDAETELPDLPSE
jgi:hypothetical protein